jgi:hypothetical protein
MREVVLRLFFEGHASAEEVARDLVGTRAEEESWSFRSSASYRVEPMSRDFEVAAEHVIRLVDGALAGALTEEDLGTLCFVLEFSDRFFWDVDARKGARVADAVFWLGTPQINYPLSPSVLTKIRHYLQSGENTLDADAGLPRVPGQKLAADSDP